MNPLVYLIILNWKNCPDTLRCLESLAQVQEPPHRILVVDNGSDDGSEAHIRDRFPAVHVIQTGRNLGYAEGNNVGIRFALQHNPAYILVLNNDTCVAPQFLNELISEAESSPDVGMVGPKMYFSHPPDMVFSAGSMIDWAKGDLVQRGIWHCETEVGPLYADNPEDVDFIIGCGVLVRREVIEKIGLLDSEYYLNFEDVDWCLRARKAGYRVRYTPKAILWHKVSASLGQGSASNTYYMTRNALRFFATNLSGWRRWRAIVRIVTRNVGHIAAWTLKDKYRQSARAKRDANVMALRDALRGRFGRMGSDVEAICKRG